MWLQARGPLHLETAASLLLDLAALPVFLQAQFLSGGCMLNLFLFQNLCESLLCEGVCFGVFPGDWGDKVEVI